MTRVVHVINVKSIEMNSLSVEHPFILIFIDLSL